MSDKKGIVFQNLKQAAAIYLWEIGAVKVNQSEPFKLASGNYSPFYINCRQVISDVTFMRIFNAAVSLLLEIEAVEADIFAGGETAGIPFACYLGAALSKPAMYVRKAKKGYGIANLVEGGDPQGKRVLLVEDLITDGGSKLHFIEALRASGAVVNDALVLFDRLQGGGKTLSENGVDLHAVIDMDTALEVAESIRLIDKEGMDSIRSYLADPEKWHEEHGLEFH